MKFQEGKYYQHSGGGVIHIVGSLPTFFYGNGLVAEDEHGGLRRVGNDEDNALNYHEVSGWPRHAYAANSIPEPMERKTSSANDGYET